jgi:hypothetical protein
VSDEANAHEELVIGRALHALDEIDRDPDDDVEVLEYNGVLQYLPFEEVAPPAALEARVLTAARFARAPEVPSLASRRRRTRRIVAVGAAAAVAAVVSLAVVREGDSSGQRTTVDFVSTRPTPAVVRELESRHGAKTFELRSTSGVVGTVVAAGDDGAVYDTTLPPVPGTSYWYWVTGPNGETVPVKQLDAGNDGGLRYTVDGEMTGALISREPGNAPPHQPTAIVAVGKLP